MGSNSSKTPISDDDSSFVESMTSELTESALTRLTIDDTAHSPSENILDISSLKAWEDELLSDSKNALMASILPNLGPVAALKKRDNVIKDSIQIFNTALSVEGAPITNQKSSGRCWLFATCNVFRVQLMKKFNLEECELSQSYLFFYDKLEKANYFLQNIIETASEPLDGRLVQRLLSEPVSDGGQWDMIINLVSKYGVIPHSCYPDPEVSIASGQVNFVVLNKLREDALVLRDLINSGSTPAKVESVRRAMVKEIFNVLELTMGPPPKPTDKFVWDFVDKNKKVQSIESTPLDFFKTYIAFDLNDHFSMIHDPRHSNGNLYQVDRLSNMVNGRPVQYVTASIDALKETAIAMLKADMPVFFGSDCVKFSDRTKGTFDTDLFDYENGLNIKFNMSKADKLVSGESALNHAMVLTAVHIVDGKPIRWRVQNSWGETSGRKGWFIASDKWFEDYVYQIVTPTALAPEEAVKARSKEATILPLWDPMGSLA
ncbi:hypothetical protein CANCADRAFT_115187 [Tortispora caseinolytica NRRL Y-17796]|uniref:Cysteine proteinase 1, mitochondrial n=1 Tax=Tortispora caseinolytica NRRL Y-17796 TaxID=767744 RepID=A0A1E4TGU8_9ASCO|nr:hypothetical protein CANCADRAFT_115187 [Tortispora caseinolytica NRRL Y-17796]